MNVSIFLDTCNLYHCVKHKYGTGKKVDFGQYYSYVSDIGKITEAKAYGARFNKNTDKFIQSLKDFGYAPVYKEVKVSSDGTRRANQNVNICIDSGLSDADTIVLGTSDNDLVPLVNVLKQRGKKVIVLSCTIGKALAASADLAIEIPYTFLRGKE